MPRPAILLLVASILLLANGLGLSLRKILSTINIHADFLLLPYVLTILIAILVYHFWRRRDILCIELRSSRIVPKTVLTNDTRNLEHILRRLSFSSKRVTYVIEGIPPRARLYIEAPSLSYEDIVRIINMYTSSIKATLCSSDDTVHNIDRCCAILGKNNNIQSIVNQILDTINRDTISLVVDTKNTLTDSLNNKHVIVKYLGDRLYVSDKLIGVISALEEFRPDILILVEPVDFPPHLIVRIVKDYNIDQCYIITADREYASKFTPCVHIY